MSKITGNKNFMVLSSSECLLAANDLMRNSESLYTSAILLSKNDSYGHATSMLIHSTEEMMKALILFLDGNGFTFRNKVKGINNLFVNHGLRYGLAMVISIIYIFSTDLKKMIDNIKSEPHLLDIKRNRASIENKLFEYLKNKIRIILIEIEWFSKAEFLRQNGLYVDYIDEIKTPLKIEKQEYESVLVRVNGMKEFVIGFMDIFSGNDEFITTEINNLKDQFKKEDWYKNLETLITIFRDQKNNPYETLITMGKDFLDELIDKGNGNKPIIK